jgi:predicted GNAT superfamily acetyltransferase
MADWNANHRACTTTWTTLRVLGQIRKNLTFEKAGAKTMEELAFWQQTASAELRAVQARSLAIAMDNIFVMLRGARYEAGSDGAKATRDIVNTLLDAGQTVADLAEVNDANYRFWKEVEE